METAVQKANEIISSFIDDTARFLSKREWYEYRTYAEVDEALRLHRLRKKFCIVTQDGKEQRKNAAFDAFRQSNSRSCVSWSREKWATMAMQDSRLREARRLVHSLFLDTTPNGPSFELARREFRRTPSLNFGPGEQVYSSGGDVSLQAKLYNHTWTVTKGANATAKKAVREHRVMRRICLREGLRKLKEHNIRQGGLTSREWYTLCFEVGYKQKTEIVLGSRLATVPKNNKTDRLINVEPLLNVGLQKSYGDILVNRLKKVGIDLELNQSLHGRLALDRSYATIDFSSASDNYGVGLIQYLFPDFVFDKLMECRSNVFHIDECYEKFNVYACMGNGTTFPVLTIITWAFGTAAAGLAWAYGDDLIIPAKPAAKAVSFMKHYGLRINEDKTFMDGPVRESCGTFSYDGKRLRSYDIRACETVLDVVRVANKVLYNAHCSAFPIRWLQLWASLSSLVWEYRGPMQTAWDSCHAVVDWLEVPVDLLEEEARSVAVRLNAKGYGTVYKVKSFLCDETRLPSVVHPTERLPFIIEEGSFLNRYLRGVNIYRETYLLVNRDGQLISTWKGAKELIHREFILFSRTQKILYEKWLEKYSITSGAT